MQVERVGVVLVVMLGVAACGAHEPVAVDGCGEDCTPVAEVPTAPPPFQPDGAPPTVPPVQPDSAPPTPPAPPAPASRPRPPPPPSVSPPPVPLACAPAVRTGSPIPEPEGGWDAAGRTPPGYVDPGTPEPWAWTEPRACVDDGRPPLASWCEKRVLHTDGTTRLLTRRTFDARGLLVQEETTSCTRDGRCEKPYVLRLFDDAGRLAYRARVVPGYVYPSFEREWLTWGADGALASRILESNDPAGNGLTTEGWTLRRACDGRPFALYTRAESPRVLPYSFAATGQQTEGPDPFDWPARAYDAQGRLRAERRYDKPVEALYATQRTVYLDTAGAPVMTYTGYSANMGSYAQWNWEEPGGGDVRTRRELHLGYVADGTTHQRVQLDAAGRPVLAWGLTRWKRHGLDATWLPPERRAERWTYACGSGEPVEHLVRVDALPASAEPEAHGETWTWDPQARTVVYRATYRHDGEAHVEYRFACGG